MNYRQVTHPISMQLCVPVEELPDGITLAARRRKPRHLVSGFSFERPGGGTDTTPSGSFRPPGDSFQIREVLEYGAPSGQVSGDIAAAELELLALEVRGLQGLGDTLKVDLLLRMLFVLGTPPGITECGPYHDFPNVLYQLWLIGVATKHLEVLIRRRRTRDMV
ncbi:hypothetical protein DEO72_LG10g2291 [Vigna unguiculata]|uniref:Uncharacterized protein n=1 Tax=Vigna unguiculata TaxID=3917 RepID=A0A4D6NCM4_VIGUN|nr:hypothetical protein DEO72_LG10g2291 [Vigna unguiculata]